MARWQAAIEGDGVGGGVDAGGDNTGGTHAKGLGSRGVSTMQPKLNKLPRD